GPGAEGEQQPSARCNVSPQVTLTYRPFGSLLRRTGRGEIDRLQRAANPPRSTNGKGPRRSTRREEYDFERTGGRAKRSRYVLHPCRRAKVRRPAQWARAGRGCGRADAARPGSPTGHTAPVAGGTE